MSQQHTLVLALRNVSATDCYLRGYPGVVMTDSQETRLAFTYRPHGDQMLTGKPPSLVQLAPGSVAYLAINKNTCVTRASVTAANIRVTPPGGHGQLGARLPRYPVLDYYGAGDPGHVIDIAPVEPNVARLLTH